VVKRIGRGTTEEALIGERDLLQEEDVIACLRDVAAWDRQALAKVAMEHGLDLVVLFGSTARGRRREGSDLDVGIRFAGPRPHPPTLEEEAMASDVLFRVLRPRCELDVVVLNGAPPLLRWNVAQHGIPLYHASPTDWVTYRIRAHRDYEDTARFRRRQWEVLLWRLGDVVTRR
jgi:predicted nucleotidyltransferase